MPEDPVSQSRTRHDDDELSRDVPVVMLREVVSGYHLERASRVTAKALDEEVLPTALRQVLADYREKYPQRTIKPLTLRTTVDGALTVAIGADKLPPDERLVTFSVTEATLSSAEARVVGHVLFAQRG